MNERYTYTQVLLKFFYIFTAYTLLMLPSSFASDSLEKQDMEEQKKRRYLSKLTIPEKAKDPFSDPSYSDPKLPNMKSCHDIIRAYIGKVIGQYKLKKMVINETDIGTFVVPSDSFITYMMIMTPSNFDKIYLPKIRDKKFDCMMEGESFKGVYHLY
ncbi:MAG: hypothetical protein HRU09_15530 [Oligoflexales bacterium]|nr:hypothetical protein [Oligoflexales bacterium]